MTRSIFDPSSREAEHSGSTFGSAQADDRSHLPPDIADGKTSPEAADTTRDLQQLADSVAEAKRTSNE